MNLADCDNSGPQSTNQQRTKAGKLIKIQMKKDNGNSGAKNSPKPTRSDKFTKDDSGLKPLQQLGIEFRDYVAGKPAFVVQSDSVISLDSHFAAKKLCDGPTFTTGHACVFSCEFCYVKTVLRKNKKVRAILKETGLGFEDIVIELADPATVARKFLSGKSKPKFNDPKDERVIYASPIVDIAATMDHVKRTVAVCLAILELTHWHIRLLSKSSLLAEVARRIPEKFKHRMIYGLSSGTLDDGMAKIFEKGTALPSKRIEALHWLQDNGYRTFGMPCPTLPQRDYDQFAAEMAEILRVDRCEHVWVEVLNPRGDSLPGTAKALRNSDFDWEAGQLETLAHDKAAREDYARKTFEAFAKVIPADKLRFMQYVDKGSYGWWHERENQGAVLLGAYVNKLTGKTKKKNVVADSLTDDEKKLWAECRKGIRHEFKVCLGSYVKLGKLLSIVKEKKLHRDEYKSFETYCRKELDIAKSTAYNYITDYHVASELSTFVDISVLTKEVHIRPVTSLPEGERRQAIELLKAKLGDKPLTPQLLIDVAAEVVAMRPPPATEDEDKPGDGTGEATEVITSESIAPVADSPIRELPEVANGEMTQPDTAGPNNALTETTAAAAGATSQPESNSNPGALAAFVDTMRRVVRKASAACPEHSALLAKELRDLADTLTVIDPATLVNR